ncbi:MAG: UDP-N-acetylmuramate dehydrogenase [Ignavibacterium sp.]|nr:UDP-N-acetylmuramate dehydrogenase [Ignavibacterium sp.]
MKVYNNFSLKYFNTFGLNYTCETFIEVEYAEEIYSINKKYNLSQKKFLVLGEGSNILFTKDFDGIVLHPSFNNFTVEQEDSEHIYIKIEAGKNWDEFVRYTVEKNIGGIENLISIPGLVGAAPIQNIGAYGQEIKDTISFVHFFDFEKNVFRVYNNKQCNFGYRDSIFKKRLKNKIFITSIELKLDKNPKPVLDYYDVKNELMKNGIKNPTIKDISNIISKIRENKLPSPRMIGNAGSFFKNPIIDKNKFEALKRIYSNIPFFYLNENKVKIPAAWLIEKIGYKGKVNGNVATYHKQPLVLINLGNASGNEILDFANEIKNEILNQFDIDLELEVNVV